MYVYAYTCVCIHKIHTCIHAYMHTYSLHMNQATTVRGAVSYNQNIYCSKDTWISNFDRLTIDNWEHLRKTQRKDEDLL